MHHFLNIATNAASQAGKVIIDGLLHPNKVRITNKGANDFVTSVDNRAEACIIDIISKAYPRHNILTEESGEIHNNADITWIIDPLDGTTNFVHSLPYFSVSIAVKVGDSIEHAVVFDPVANELFTASKGRGAQLNNKRIRVTNCLKIQEALLATHFPYKGKGLDQKIADYCVPKLSELFFASRDVRSIGSAALSLAFVAAGRLDGYWEMGLQPWDVAAGSLLVQEAGGFVSDFQGEQEFMQGAIIAANSKVHSDMLAKLKSD